MVQNRVLQTTGKHITLKDLSNISSKSKKKFIYIYIQGVPLILVQTLRGGREHEDEHYSVGNNGVQTSSVGARGR